MKNTTFSTHIFSIRVTVKPQTGNGKNAHTDRSGAAAIFICEEFKMENPYPYIVRPKNNEHACSKS